MNALRRVRREQPGRGSSPRFRWIAAALAFAPLAAAAARAEFPAERAFQIVDLAPGVFAFVNPETSRPFPSGNVLVVVGDEGTLVVDSGRFPTLARRAIAEIRRRTSQPVRFLVHTHWHLDHIAADGAFRAAFPNMTFLATDFTRRKMIEKQAAYLRDVRTNDAEYVRQLEAVLAKGTRPDGSPIPKESADYLRGEVSDLRLEAEELGGARLVEPDATFDRALTVHLGRREVRVLFLGAGNTAGDTVVYVPDARVVAAGDLLVAPTPYGYGCHPSEWIATLKKLMALDAAAIVPGHGPVERDWSYARKVLGLLEAVRERAGAAAARGATLDQTLREVDLEDFRAAFAGEDYGRSRAFRDFFVRDAVTRAWQEARGTVAEE